MERKSNQAFQCAAAETQGLRPSHEDTHNIAFGDTSAGDFWVCDGHRGSEAAKFGVRALSQEVGQAIQNGKLPSDARVYQAFRTIDNQLRKHLKQHPEEHKAGCTVIGALVARQSDGTYNAKIVNCGDSRGLIIRAPTSEEGDDKKKSNILETADHRPDVPSEKARILAAGGHVTGTRCPRVDGRLAVSRSLGDFDFKADKSRQPQDQKVSCIPDCYEATGLKPGTILVLACDGLWGVVDSKAAAKMIRDRLRRDPYLDLGELAAAVVRLSLQRGSDDNVTVLIVRLGGGKLPPAEVTLSSVETKVVAGAGNGVCCFHAARAA